MKNLNRAGPWAACLTALAMAASTAPTQAQTNRPSSVAASAVLAGYGTANYGGTFADSYAHDFTVTMSPILLFGIGEDVLFEAEFEFELEGSNTETAIEYAQVDYLAFDRVQFTLGKFLLPFGVFGERLHPSWINKLPTMPSLYGHAHGGVAEGALLPILSDVGAMARFTQPLGSQSSLNASFYVTQGPSVVVPEAEGEEDGHAHSIAPRVREALSPGYDDPIAADLSELGVAVPVVAFGTNTADNNQNKMLGARLGYVHGGSFETHLSGFHAMYDEDDYLDYTGAALSFDWRRGQFDFKAEGVYLRQEIARPDLGEYQGVVSKGYYLQAARRFDAVEPVVRWSHLLQPELDGTAILPRRQELALGVNYWLAPSVPLKLAYSWNPDFDDRLLLQWAFGF